VNLWIWDTSVCFEIKTFEIFTLNFFHQKTLDNIDKNINKQFHFINFINEDLIFISTI